MSEYDESQIMRETARAEERESKQAERADIAEHELDALRAENARLREERRWIPVTERLPEHSGAYLVYSPDVPEGCGGNVWQVAFFDYKMRGVNEWATSYPVTHWQPLPEPPALEPQP